MLMAVDNSLQNATQLYNCFPLFILRNVTTMVTFIILANVHINPMDNLFEKLIHRIPMQIN